MARILVLGGTGMLGHIVTDYLSTVGHEVRAVSRTSNAGEDQVDVENTESLRGFLAGVRPEVVINCVGVLVKASDDNVSRAIRINALLPQVLSQFARELGFRLIHASTDCVFSGRNGPYIEDSERNAIDTYGMSKILGELNNSLDLTIRTSIIGPEIVSQGTGLFHWFMGQKTTVSGFSQVLWGGVTTLEWAKAADWVIGHPTVGLVHLTNGLPISKFDLLLLFAKIWGKSDVEISKDDTLQSNKALKSTRSDFGYCVPSYETMLSELHGFMRTRSPKYRQYEGLQ